MKVIGFILSGSAEDNLGSLTAKRTSAAVPVFGKYRAIDFTLSNMVNSGITKVGVLTQYNPRSLMDHLGSGKEWNLDRKRGGMYILQPFMDTGKHQMYYKGTADSLFQNMSILKKSYEDFVLIGSGDHVYNTNYKDLFKTHIRNGADITLITKKVPEDFNVSLYGQIEKDNNNRIKKIYEKNTKKISNEIFTGVYFINKSLLNELLYSTVPNGKYDLLLDMIIPNLDKIKVMSYEIKGYWRNIKKSIDDYYNINMDILNKDLRNQIFYSDGKIYTKLTDSAPPKININADIGNSFIADGSIINGKVRNSILSRGVIIKAGAVIENSIILQNSIIEEGAIIKNTIIDKDATIRERKQLIGSKTQIICVDKGAVI